MKKIDYNQVEIQMLWKPFQEVMKSFSLNKEKTKILFEEFVRRYSVRGRHYHTIHHIVRMVGIWEVNKDKFTDPNVVFLAIIYHDIVYNPKRNDNEEKSMLYFIKNIFPLLKADSKRLAKVSLIIMATTHTSDMLELAKGDFDVQFMLDMDLEILSTRHESEYEWYRTGVRKEYGMYSDAQYKKGRKAVLESFLKRKKIYLTKNFKSDEKRARKNLRNEIKSYLC